MRKEDENKYAYLDQLSTRELREILRADIDSPESGDDEAIFYILEVMEKREREHPSDASSDLDRCWNDFQTLYHTPEGAGRALYPTEDPEVPKQRPSASPRGRRYLRWLVLAEYGITEDVVPTWMPEGFEIQGEVFVQEFSNPRNIQFFTLYSDGEDSVTVNIIKHVGVVEGKIYEKTTDNPEVHTTGGIEHHIFQSANGFAAWSAVWYNDDLECSINTTLTKSDLEKILDSIYEE